MRETPDELIPTRTTLIQRLKNWQDESSWQQFFDTYWKLIYGVALKSGLNDAEAQDVVQETMISVARHMPGFTYDRKIGSFKGWLLNMTRWRITDQIRKRKALGQSFGEDAASGPKKLEETIDPNSGNMEALWEAEWERNLYDAATAKIKRQLDPQKYQIFDLYVKKEWAPEKVAETFGIAVDQVYLTKHRVAELIKQEVERLRAQMS